MSQSMTNGEKPSSQFISHLTSYPVVSDSIETYKSNPYGAKSLDLAHATYDRFAAPVVRHLQGPYSYVAPYVAKADEIADGGLGKVDDKFPIVKEDTSKILDDVKQTAFMPFRLAAETRDYAFKTYNEEYKKQGDQGVIGFGKAVIYTNLRFTDMVFQKIADFLGHSQEVVKQKGQEAKEKTQEKMNN